MEDVARECKQGDVFRPLLWVMVTVNTDFLPQLCHIFVTSLSRLYHIFAPQRSNHLLVIWNLVIWSVIAGSA